MFMPMLMLHARAHSAYPCPCRQGHAACPQIVPGLWNMQPFVREM
jgi:hypothetical protein